MTLEVVDGLPPDWHEYEQDFPVLARRRWIELGTVWYPGPLLTIRAGGGGVAITGTVLAGPVPARRRCPWAICSGSMASDGFATDGPHPWAGLDADLVFPCLFLMFPYYLGDLVGPGATDHDALDSFLAGVEGLARERGCRSVAFMYATVRQEQDDALARAGYERIPIIQHATLHVGWPDLDGYLASFSSRRRQRLRKDLRDLESAGVQLAEEAMPEDLEDLVSLRCSMLRKYEALGSVDDERSMVHRVAAIQPRDSVSVMTARHEGRLVAYTAFVRDGRQWTPILTGSDYSPASECAYFATTYYHPAALAAQRGIDVIDYGAGSAQTKQLRGCQLTDLVAYVKRF